MSADYKALHCELFFYSLVMSVLLGPYIFNSNIFKSVDLTFRAQMGEIYVVRISIVPEERTFC